MRAGLVVALAVCGCAPKLRLDPERLPPARVGQSYHAIVTVREHRTPVGGVSASSLPAGLSLSHASFDETFAITGVPTLAGDFDVTIDGWCYGTNFAGQKLHVATSLRVLPP